MNFKRGFDFEDRIVTKLEHIGCRLQRDQRLDHKYKLDFKVISFPDNPGTYSLGVQVTAKRDDFEKQQDFENVQRASNVAQKALYLELTDNLDLEDGGALAVLTVISSFQFDRRFQDSKVQGAVIYPDYSYEFFNLAERSRSLRENARQQFLEQHRPSPATPLQLEQLNARYAPGVLPSTMPGDVSAILTAYKRSDGYGFATSNEGENYFVHVNAVIDDRLRDELNHVPYSEIPYPVEIPLVFGDGGYTRPGAKYKAAKNIRLRSAMTEAAVAS
ncbi:MAG TPA: hypothetical protein VHB50_12915 [Bryobacteraceae bacterium]|nr:hypothetical protein [Bryobacteraceae bacterium]